MIINNAPFYIEVSEDNDYSFNSTDNIHSYDVILNPENRRRDDFHKKISIKTEDKSALLICGYCSYSDNVLFVDNLLVIMCENIIYKIDVEKMEIVFRKVMCASLQQLDEASEVIISTEKSPVCISTFEIHKIQNGYIVYGEMEILKLDDDFNVLSMFMGKDIFVTVDGSPAFEMNENGIVVRDFIGNIYYLDYNCKLIKEVIK